MCVCVRHMLLNDKFYSWSVLAHGWRQQKWKWTSWSSMLSLWAEWFLSWSGARWSRQEKGWVSDLDVVSLRFNKEGEFVQLSSKSRRFWSVHDTSVSADINMPPIAFHWWIERYSWSVFNSLDSLKTCPALSYQTMKMMRSSCVKFTEFFWRWDTSDDL